MPGSYPSSAKKERCAGVGEVSLGGGGAPDFLTALSHYVAQGNWDWLGLLLVFSGCPNAKELP